MHLGVQLLRPVASVLVALVILGTPACNKSTPTTPSSTDVVAFGDSLTFGIGATTGNNYVAVLARRVGVSIHNAGWPGDTTGSALSRLSQAVLSRNPRLVVVLLGGNDLLQGVPVPTRVTNIRMIVERIRNTGAAVILVGLGQGQLDPFDGALPGIATSTGSTYVPDVLEGIIGNPALLSDAIHPNDAGYALMADRIEPALRQVLLTIG
jgi:lysophospholipase L1-like esterase